MKGRVVGNKVREVTRSQNIQNPVDYSKEFIVLNEIRGIVRIAKDEKHNLI